ncbi:MAG: hypothetical protein GY827_11840 [Cytophagales bacterium]|nr:hypothetical protein [Cytophagales bacterium]
MKKSTWILIIAFLLLSLGGYYLSNVVESIPTNFEQKNNQTYWLYGNQYAGKIKEQAFGQMFDKAEKVIKEKKLNAHAGALYQIDTTVVNKYYVKAFVGIISSDSIVNPDPSLTLKKVTFDKALVVTQESNRFFNNIYNQVIDYLEKNKLSKRKDDQVELEIYLKKDKIQVVLPLE